MQKQKKNNKSTKGPAKMLAVPAARSLAENNKRVKSVRLAHREFAFSLSGNSASFQLLGLSASFPGYDINPGNSQVFPWLSRVASAYEKYRFENLEFEIIPRNPTTVSGAVSTAIDYDFADEVANSPAELMSNQGAVSADVWSPCTMRVDCARMNQDLPWRYVASFPRSGPDVSERLVYGGFLMVGIAGTTTTVAFDVFVKYTVCLDLPAVHSTSSALSQALPAAQTLAAGVYTGPSILPVVAGVRKVLSGLNGVPALGTVLAAGSPAYDVGSVQKGNLSFTAKLATAGSPPSAYGADTAVDASCFDANGVSLGPISSTSPLLSIPFPGPDSLATWATNGAVSNSGWSVNLADLRKLYPTLAYIAPHFFSSAGRVLSTASSVATRYVDL